MLTQRRGSPQAAWNVGSLMPFLLMGGDTEAQSVQMRPQRPPGAHCGGPHCHTRPGGHSAQGPAGSCCFLPLPGSPGAPGHPALSGPQVICHVRETRWAFLAAAVSLVVVLVR